MVIKNNIEDRMLELESRVTALEQRGSNIKATSSTKQISPKEFLMRYGASDNDVQNTFLLCCYAEFEQGKEHFNVEDLRSLFGAARVRMPKNLNDAMNKNIKKGFLTESQERGLKKSWVVTMTGERSFTSMPIKEM